MPPLEPTGVTLDPLTQWAIQHPAWVYASALFLWGLCTGSLVGALTYRVPRKLSMVHPPSLCPCCGKQISLLELLPVVNYLLLGGRCRGCDVAVPWRYPVIELSTALLCAWIAWHHAALTYAMWISTALLAARIIFAVLVFSLIVIDLETRLLPNELTYLGLALGLIAACVLPIIPGLPDLPQGMHLAHALLGAGAGGGILWIFRWIGTRAMRRTMEQVDAEDADIGGAVGWGDIKLMAMTGAWLGWQSVIVACILGLFLCALGAIPYRLLTGTSDRNAPGLQLATRWRTGAATLPFGPALGAGSILSLVHGPALWHFITTA